MGVRQYDKQKDDRHMTEHDKDDTKPRTALIKDHLRRAFEDKAKEDIPDDLIALLQKLKLQDDTDGKE